MTQMVRSRLAREYAAASAKQLERYDSGLECDSTHAEVPMKINVLDAQREMREGVKSKRGKKGLE